MTQKKLEFKKVPCPPLHCDLLHPDEDTPIMVSSASVGWFDELGIYNSMSLKTINKPPLEEFKAETKEWGRLFKDKTCMLTVNDGKATHTKEERLFAEPIFNKIIKVLAIVTNSYLSKMAANSFLLLTKSNFPVKFYRY